tara:strand:- start:1326 stop:1994 length:669 start_codon:yes stop_codon:yes gene_type:complete
MHAAIRSAAASIEPPLIECASSSTMRRHVTAQLALAKRSRLVACFAVSQYDGKCDDGGPGAEYSACTYGSDCDDCDGDIHVALRVTRAIIPTLFCCCCCGAPSAALLPARRLHDHRSRAVRCPVCSAVGLGVLITQQKRRRARFAVHSAPVSYQQGAAAAQRGGYPAASVPVTAMPVAQGTPLHAQPVVVAAYVPDQPPVVHGTAVIAHGTAVPALQQPAAA